VGATVRVCVVGGGSYNWGPILLGDLAATQDLAGTVVLHDLDAAAGEELCRLGRKLVAAAGSGLSVEAIPDQREALRGADAVVVTITTGGLEAMRHDLEVPLRYGIRQAVGDTVGPGGLSRALRNVPVVVEIARTMEEVCPDAWLINLSNPMAALVRAVAQRTRIKVVGLCHEVLGVRRVLARLFEAPDDGIELQVAGTNHLPWLLAVGVGGEDGLARLRAHLAAGGEIPLKPRSEEHLAPFQDRWRIKLALFDMYGYLPAAGDRHLAEFFPHFLSEAAGGGADHGVLLTRIEHREAMLRTAKEKVRAWLDGRAPLPTGRSGEEVADVILALATGRERLAVVNLPNRGQVDNLPREAVVETIGLVGATGIRGIGVGALPLGVLATVQPHVLNQELIVEAALSGDRQLAVQAFLADPLVGVSGDFRAVPRLVDDLIAANRTHLPRFPA
jgi:alpha-galactosidase/6-phospho-beta-glucosidase family protein